MSRTRPPNWSCKPAHEAEDVAAGADVDRRRRTPGRRSPARPRARSGWRPWCGTPARPARRRRLGDGRARGRTTKSCSVLGAGARPGPGRLDGRVELGGHRRLQRGDARRRRRLPSRSTRAWRTSGSLRLPLLELVRRAVALAGRPRSARASGRSRPPRRPGRRPRGRPTTASAIAAATATTSLPSTATCGCRTPRPGARAWRRAGRTPARTRRSRCSRRRRRPGGATRRPGSAPRGRRPGPARRRRRTPPPRCRRRGAGRRSAAPTAIGMPAATIPLAPKMPRVGSAMCIEPPRPRLVPSSLAISSANIPSGSRPLARQWPWPRWVDVMTSAGRSGQHAPTAAASCPIDRCTKPGTSPSRYRADTRCSNPRMQQHPSVHLERSASGVRRGVGGHETRYCTDRYNNGTR